MTEADDIREAGKEAGAEMKRAVTEAVRLADGERLQLTDKVQEDRRYDALPERDRTTDQIQQDRRDDQAPERKRTTDQIQQDRRDDEAPRTALELVRADKLTHSLILLEAVRKICIALLVVMVALGVSMVFMFDYMGDNRARTDSLQTEIEATNDATERVEGLLRDFDRNNQEYIDNHSRTQRLICAWFRANDVALPDNGDCENR